MDPTIRVTLLLLTQLKDITSGNTEWVQAMFFRENNECINKTNDNKYKLLNPFAEIK